MLSTDPQSHLAAAEATLHRVFGFPAFRPLQGEVIGHVVGGGDAVVLMPTGGGKSLCYQIPAMVRPGLGIVVSPLIALMRDQVAALRQADVSAAALNSSLPFEEQDAVLRQVAAGALDLLYVAPERLMTERTLGLLAGQELALIAIDEAHCVSQWGHDFRPEYRQLAALAERFPGVPRLALTATADAATLEDLRRGLALGEARLFSGGFDRPNIRYRVIPKAQPRQQLLRFLRGQPEGTAGIVYCLTRKAVEETAAWLRTQGLEALPYHAGLSAEERARNQDIFLSEEGVVVVATVAFGMGIDKPNVRFVVHLDCPKSLEAYYQETGRAGRDGLPAEALLLYGYNDVARLRGLLVSEGGVNGGGQRRIEHGKLDALLGYCETAGCRRRALLGYFGERLDSDCGNCDRCLTPVALEEATELGQMALSAVARTGERFGVGHLVEVLLGNENDRVRRFGHDRLKTFGIGKAKPKAFWQSLYRQLLAQGLLAIDPEGHGALKLTPASWELLRGQRGLEVAAMAADPLAAAGGKAAGRSRGKAAVEALPDDPEIQALFAKLRAWRLETAKAQGVPPYVVFHDSTLAALAAERPTSLAALGEVPGVGASKLMRYGAALLEQLT